MPVEPVKHADETGWRNDGRNGYAWLFCTPRLSLFRFRQSRSAKVALELFGKKRLPGTLVIDRYAAYNKILCSKQYCYAHLLREVQDLGKEFAEPQEVPRFVETLAPLLAQAMKVRAQGLELREFRRQAGAIKAQILQSVESPAQHPGIQKIQNIFRENAPRLYHWTRHPSIPAENNRAERELRPLVIARKISFGSQSEQGLKTREVLYERAPHPEQTNRKPICHFHQGSGCAHDQPNAKSLSTVVQFFLTRSNPAVTDALHVKFLLWNSRP